MKHVVICWEMGGGLGHLIPLSLLGEELIAQGCRVSFIVNDIAHAPRYLDHLGVKWLPAPRLKPLLGATAPVLRNHADILQMAGYADSDRLYAMLSSWRTMLEMLGADQLICEYAPTAQLAAMSLNIPYVCIDNGFSMPPVSSPMPALREEMSREVHALLESEQRTLSSINAAMKRCKAPMLPRFSYLYETDVWYRNWPEFNHFGQHSLDRHLGQIVCDTDGVEPQWTAGEGPRLFAYLKADCLYALDMLMAAIAHGFRVLAYLPGHPVSGVQRLLSTGRAQVSKFPVKLSALDEEVEIGIWQSPTGGVGHSLEKGMRMMFAPTQVEQYLACRAVERSGVPACIVRDGQDWRLAFDSLMQKPKLKMGGRWNPADLPAMAVTLIGR